MTPELVEKVAFILSPWNKKLEGYMGENPAIERDSARERERKAAAMKKAKAVIHIIESALLREMLEPSDAMLTSISEVWPTVPGAWLTIPCCVKAIAAGIARERGLLEGEE